MTESKWLSCDDPQKMLAHLYAQRGYARKLRLFACACCRHMWDSLKDARSRNAVEVAERYVERKAKRDEADRAAKDAHDAICEGLARKTDGDTSNALHVQIETADAAWRA